MTDLSRRTLLMSAAGVSNAATEYRIIDPHVHVWVNIRGTA